MVKLSVEELYVLLQYNCEVKEWVKEHIIPTLKDPKVNREEAVQKIRGFIGDAKPYALAAVNEFDAICLYKLFGTGNERCNWIPINCSSILFALGFDPEGYWRHKGNFFKDMGLDVRPNAKNRILYHPDAFSTE